MKKSDRQAIAALLTEADRALGASPEAQALTENLLQQSADLDPTS